MLLQTYKVWEGQSFYDVAAAAYGDCTLASDLAIANGLCVTDTLQAGQVLLLVEGKPVLNVLQVYKNNNIVPATATHAILPAAQDGIGFMTIGTTFRVR